MIWLNKQLYFLSLHRFLAFTSLVIAALLHVLAIRTFLWEKVTWCPMYCYPWHKMLIQKRIDLKLQFNFIDLDCEFYVLNFIILICISPLCHPQVLGIFVCVVREDQNWVGWLEFIADLAGGIGIFLLCGIYLGCNPQLQINLIQQLNYSRMLLFCGLMYSCT